MSKHINSFSGKNDKGFTLVEILVSLVILLILVIAFVPLFTFVSQAIASNKARDVAVEIATQKMEEMRTLPYIVMTDSLAIDVSKPQLGLISGDPPGSVNPTETVKVNNITYTVKTDIAWGDDGKSFKIVTVSVEAPGIFNKEVKISNQFDTMAAQEGVSIKRGSILVEIYDSKGELLTDSIQVSVKTLDYQSDPEYTSGGQVLFTNLPNGIYEVYAQVPADMMCHPDLIPQFDESTRLLSENNVTITYNKEAKVSFTIDRPAKISLEMYDRSTNSKISNANIIESRLIIDWNETNTTILERKEITFNKNDIDDGKLSSLKTGSLWPSGTYTFKLIVNKNLTGTDLKPYAEYDMALDPVKPIIGNNTLWNGTLSAGDNQTVKVSLESLLKAHLISSKGITTRGNTTHISCWADQSGYGNDATNSNNNSTQPTLSGSTVVFDMSKGQTLTMPSDSVNSVICTNDFVVFAVAKATQINNDARHEIDETSNSDTKGTSGQRYLFYPDHGGDHAAGMGISLGSNGFSNYEHGSNYMPATAVYGSPSITILKGGLFLTDFIFNTLAIKYQNSENKRPVMYLNGIQTDGTYMKTRYSSARSTVYSPTIIGGGNYGYFNGEVKEILIYKSALPETNIQQINNYLNANH